MTPRKLLQLVAGARRPRRDRLVLQIAPDIAAKSAAEAYRRALSFSSALATMVSMSPR